jgi:hypothetical protein
MELQEALSRIAEIRQQVARTEVFRGYRAVPVALSGVLALAAAVLQPYWVPDPLHSVSDYLALWVGAAALSLAATALEMAWSLRASPSALDRQKTLLAVSQFVPCLVAGGLLTVVMARSSPENVCMLPGLWAMFFGLGVFASHRLLPPPVFWVGVFYIGAGALTLGMARGDHAFSPWAMGLPFGIGQLLSAAILYWTLEVPGGQE